MRNPVVMTGCFDQRPGTVVVWRTPVGAAESTGPAGSSVRRYGQSVNGAHSELGDGHACSDSTYTRPVCWSLQVFATPPATLFDMRE